MKKVLAIVAIAAFAACNNGEVKTSTEDSLKKVDSLAKAAKDSVKAAADTTIKKIDSAKTAIKDSIKAK